MRLYQRMIARAISSIYSNTTSTDPYYNLVQLMMRAKTDATTGQQNKTFVDSSTNNFTVSNTGAPTQGTASPYATGGSSMYFSGADILTVPYNAALVPGAGDYTIEMWFNLSDLVGNRSLFSASYGSYGIVLQTSAANLTAYVSSTGTTWDKAGGTVITALSPTTWYHVAFVKSAGAVYIYINGELKTTIASVPSMTWSSGAFAIGNHAGSYFKGFISDFRVTKGVAVYTSPFTVPSTPLTAITGTQLLLSGNNSAIQNITAKANIVTVGNASASTSVQKFNSASMYFDGAGDYVTSTPIPFGAGDFTIEGWHYLTGKLTNQPALFSNYNSYTAGSLALYAGHASSSATKYQVAINAGAFPASALVSNSTIRYNEWVHFALVRTAGKLWLYINGILDNSIAIASTVTLNGVGSNFYIGASGDNLGATYIQGYIEDFRVTPGVARYRTDFAIDSISPTAALTTGGDLYYGQTVLHMHMEGTNGSAVFAEQKGIAPSAITTATISTDTKKFGTSSAKMLGSSKITFPADAKYAFAGDFTIEGWVNFNSITSPNNQYLFDIGSNGVYFRLMQTTWQLVSGAANLLSWDAGTISLNSWIHWAIVRKEGILKMYINGVAVASVANSSVIGSNSAFSIGNYGAGGNYGVNGYIDEVRVTNGIARYSANFTPATAAFSDYQDMTSDVKLNQSILLKANKVTNGNNLVVDSSSNGFTFTKTGNPAQGTFSPFSNAGVSTWFKGTSDSLNLSSNALSNDTFGNSSEFTFEAWVNPTGNSWSLAGWCPNVVGQQQWQLSHDATNGINMQFFVFGSSSVNITSSGAKVPLNKWTHIVMQRNSANVFTIYFNGVPQAVSNNAYGTYIGYNLSVTNGVAGIGNAAGYTVGTNDVYITNFRFTKAVVYSEGFTPSTTALPVLANTTIVACANRLINTVSGSVSGTLVATGTPGAQPLSPFNPSIYSSAVHGGSVYFTGTDNLIASANAAFGLGVGDFTIESWVYHTVTASNLGTLVDLRTTANTSATAVRIDSANKVLVFNGPANANIISAATVPSNQWVHIAVTRQSNVISIFINGVKDATTATVTSDFGTTQPCLIGGNYTAGYGFAGYLSDFRIIKGTALYSNSFTPATAPAEIQANTSVWLKGQASNIIDVTGKSNFSTVGTSKVLPGTKRWNSAISFSTAGDMLVSPDQAANNLAGGDWTIEMWIKPNGTYATYNTLIAKRNGTTTACSYELYLAITSGLLTFYNGSTYASTMAPIIGAWNHIAATLQGTTLRMFVNGAQCYAGTIAATANVAFPLHIGNVSTGGETFYGQMEDVRITKGVARYLTNFVVPTDSFPTV